MDASKFAAELYLDFTNICDDYDFIDAFLKKNMKLIEEIKPTADFIEELLFYGFITKREAETVEKTPALVVDTARMQYLMKKVTCRLVEKDVPLFCTLLGQHNASVGEQMKARFKALQQLPKPSSYWL